MMKKKLTLIMITLLTTALFTGCVNTIPEMTEDQQALVVEYAVGELLKHDANYDGKLTETVLIREEEADQADGGEPETIPEQAAGEESRDPSPVQGGPVSDGQSTDEGQGMQLPEESAVPAEITLESFLGLEGARVTYNGYETTEFYPSDVSEVYFVMNATDGNELLVLKFMVENMTDADLAVDMAQKEIRFRIIVDGEEKNALTTMLLNDMGYYQGALAAGESTELVLVCEIPEAQSSGIQSLELYMKNAEASTTISLQ